MKVVTATIQKTQRLAADFVHKLKPGQRAKVVGLQGELGSGKTAFAQAAARAAGIKEPVVSPTFLIMRVYKLPPRRQFKHFIHIDAYRLEDASELVHLGFREFLKDSSNIIFIEWPERVDSILPAELIKITFKHIDDQIREVTIN